MLICVQISDVLIHLNKSMKQQKMYYFSCFYCMYFSLLFEVYHMRFLTSTIRHIFLNFFFISAIKCRVLIPNKFTVWRWSVNSLSVCATYTNICNSRSEQWLNRCVCFFRVTEKPRKPYGSGASYAWTHVPYGTQYIFSLQC